MFQQFCPNNCGGRGCPGCKPHMGPSWRPPIVRESRPCCRFRSSGTCRFGDRCRYTHDSADNWRPRARPCKHFMRTGSCHFGTMCRFSHTQLPFSFASLGSDATSDSDSNSRSDIVRVRVEDPSSAHMAQLFGALDVSSSSNSSHVSMPSGRARRTSPPGRYRDGPHSNDSNVDERITNMVDTASAEFLVGGEEILAPRRLEARRPPPLVLPAGMELALAGLQVPAELQCPISLDLMLDPVVASDGHTYDRSNIEQWLEDESSSPITREPLDSKHIFANRVVRTLVMQFIETTAAVKG